MMNYGCKRDARTTGICKRDARTTDASETLALRGVVGYVTAYEISANIIA